MLARQTRWGVAGALLGRWGLGDDAWKWDSIEGPDYPITMMLEVDTDVSRFERWTACRTVRITVCGV